MTYYSTPTAKFAHDHGMTEEAVVRMMDEVIDESLSLGEPDDNFVSEDDVKDAEIGIVVRYGSDHGRYLPGAHE